MEIPIYIVMAALVLVAFFAMLASANVRPTGSW